MNEPAADADYWRDAIAMALVDEVDEGAIFKALVMSQDMGGAEFNAAIWAAAKLDEIVCGEK